MATVTNQTEFKNAVSNSEPEIIIANDISLTSPTNVGYTVSIKGEPGVSLLWTGASSARPMMLIVTATGDLTIESLTLDAEGRNGTLVHVDGGKFTMNEGTTLKNIYSRSSRNAVRVGDLMASHGGAFIMNGGLITGVDSSDAVFCGGGTVIMDNDAAISDNMSAGLTATDSNGIRSSLTMSGRSRISNNQSRQGASAGIIMGTDIIMGVREGDAPLVTGNQSPVYPVGGWLLSDSTSLTMRYNAEISDNYSIQYGGGLTVSSESTISMHDNAVIKNNKSDSSGGGLVLVANSKITMEDHAQILDNVCSGSGGGIHLQSGSVLQMKGNAAIHGNAARRGAGIYLNTNSTASMDLDDSSLGIYENEAADQGGGVFISARSTLDLMGHTHIRDNLATEGKGVYKVGTLNLSQSPQILDGLFFDDLQTDSSNATHTNSGDALSVTKFQVQLDVLDHISAEFHIATDTTESTVGHTEAIQPIFNALRQAYSDNVPIITDTLTGDAKIQLESSNYVSPLSVAVVIADKGSGYAQLGETDRAAWRIPQEFGPGYAVILNDTLDQVLIVYETYSIIYQNLHGAENPNPNSYIITDLPIILKDPGVRAGYIFKGWYNAEGQRITEIPVGITGDIILSAAWEKVFLIFNGNATCVSEMPEAIHIELGETIPIPATTPYRSCYCFAGWNTSPSGTGDSYAPGGVITVVNGSIELYAQWRRKSNCCHNNRYRD